ncbi:expressed unknown protein [Seminavis robusta]|uniref:Uncharacterized protein n=1 Tax=Seminavis robusta TaxID=568900 RepID=A0A9N8H8F5_9STRA|nr:expressed unknown protein [Seminavis robusta]|eukprot:Sro90_g047320.1 n/a (156) ;mRNA; f:39214-39681
MSIPKYVYVPTPWCIPQESGDPAPAIPLRILTNQGSDRWSDHGAGPQTCSLSTLPPTLPVRQSDLAEARYPPSNPPLRRPRYDNCLSMLSTDQHLQPLVSHEDSFDAPPRQPSRRCIGDDLTSQKSSQEATPSQNPSQSKCQRNIKHSLEYARAA